MSPVLRRLRSVVVSPWFRWLAAPAAVVAVVGSVIGQSALPPLVSLAAEPLYARGARAKPTLTLALSVEFPTVGAQFTAPIVNGQSTSEDDTYDPAQEYVGYFDVESCYVYNDVPTETPAAGKTLADYKRFDRQGDADRDADKKSLHTCAGQAFSGNFMNWASSSAIDILRFGLSGGDRVIDEAALTVLQRAYLPSNFWNSSNFPAKKLLAARAAGATPSNLRTTTAGTAWTGDVYIASCANRIHFGTARAGSCGSPGQNADLGVKVASVPSNGVYTGTLPAGFTYVAAEYYSGSNFGTAYPISGTKQILYGGGNKWASITRTGGSFYCSNAWFATQNVPGLPASGDPIQGTQKACYTRDPVADNGPGVTADGFMYSRVRVCDYNTTGLKDPRTSLCLQYPSGAYKPVGNLQKYSDRMRVAAFGYLNDSTGNPNERYGGVLRAPMKYVGPKYFNANFTLLSGSNPEAEWDEQTGILVVNPGSATEGRSGVINYLNQFGRTGPAPGTYKTYDPVGELYYESLRYLQGLAPTAAALPASTASAASIATWADGFPVYSTWTDPHPAVEGLTDYSCVRNSIVAIGDVNTHNDKTIPGNTRTTNDSARAANPAGNEPDFYQWTKVVGGFESNNSVAYLDGKGVSRTTSNPNTPANTARWGMENQNIGADGASYYMAGMAYWANTHDIRGAGWTDGSGAGTPSDKRRPGMRVSTYVLDVNEFGQQTDPTKHRNNQFFLASKYGGFNDGTTQGTPFYTLKTGSTPTAPVLVQSNASWEASPTGSNEAANYFLSSSAKAVLAALDNIFAKIATDANSIAGGAISTQQLSTADNYIYQAKFDPADWSGDVAVYSVAASDAGGAVTIKPATNLPWTSAAEVMNQTDPKERKIFVGTSAGAAPFLWSSTLASSVKDALQTPIGASAPTDSAAVGELRLNYLRGDRSQETGTGTFRRRGNVLGDIVNSSIAYSGTPATRFQNTSLYGDFYETNKSRKKTIFVGANDGMLHAFDTATGRELFAYIPSWVVPRLSDLTSPNYVHRSYVDGSPTVLEAKVGTAWKTVLVSGTGGGGQGVFAIDVTNPDPLSTASNKFDASKIMWEFTDSDDASLGNVVGHPRILPFRTTATGGVKYFAVFGSGVNNYAADGHASSTGAAALFLLDLSKPAGTAWSEGTNYFKVVLPTPDNSLASGLLNFTARVDDTGVVTTIYSGDLQGNMWKLDFTRAAAGTTDWTLAKLSPFVAGSNGARLPLYIAKDAVSPISRQPISMEPSIAYGAGGSIIVVFGTGKFLEVPDISGNYKKQSVYAVLDDGSTTVDTSDSAVAGRGRLREGTVSGGSVVVPSFDWGRPTSDSATSSVRAGWYFDLPDSTLGERQVSGFELAGNNLVFGSVIPSVNSCDNGSGNLYVISLLTGSGTYTVSTVGIFGRPLLPEVADASFGNTGGEQGLTRSDTTGRRVRTTRKQIIVEGSGGISTGSSIVTQQYVGRLSWRELSTH